MNTHKRARVTLALASCLLAVPSANAMVQGDGGRTYGPVGDDHARVASVTPTAGAGLFTPGDDHARVANVTPIGTSGTFTSGDGHARTAAVTPPVSPSVTADAGGFDWNDAGIGFGMAAGLALLAGGTLLTSRKMRAPRTPAT